jgi:NTE family protein
MDKINRALVLGSGGPAAIAWEIGLITGLAEEGIDLRNADLFVGTSAGSVVAAEITSGVALEELFQAQVDPRLQIKEIKPPVDFNRLKNDLAMAKEGESSVNKILQRVGLLAMGTQTVSEPERRNVIAMRLPVHIWPEKKLLVVSVNVASGERCVFDRNSEANLVDAVAASCAVPATWPPVTIGSHRFMDGGVYSTENADLAEGYERVLVLALTPRKPPIALVPLEEALKTLQSKNSRVEVVRPNQATEAAFASVGGNLLDPAVREIAARSGLEQGRGEAAVQITSFWRD